MSLATVLLVPYYHSFRSETERPYCLNYSNSSGELAATRFTYNSKGFCDKAYYQQITGNRSSQNFHEFDAERRMIRKSRKYNDGETSEELFIYEGGKLLKETFVSSCGQKGETRYEYDSDGNAVKMHCSKHKGWLDASLGFDFDADGRRLAGRVIRKDGTKGTIEYRYDRAGTLIFELWDVGDGQWTQTMNYVYEPIGYA